MANIFYDRSGKAHTIGEKKNTDEKNVDQKPRPQKSPHKNSASPKPSSRSDEHKKRVESDRPAHKKHSTKGKFEKAAPEGRSAKKSPWSKEKPSRGKTSGSEGRHGGESRGGGRGQEFRGSKEGLGKVITDGESTRSFVPKIGFAGERGGGRNERGGGRNERGRSGKVRGEVRGNRRPPTSKRHSSESVNPNWQTLKGVIDKNKRGSAFLVFDRSDLEDVFIPRYYVEQLFHGDRVEAVISQQGEIENLKVLQHRFKEIFGRVHIEERMEGHGKSKIRTKAGFLIYERKKAKEEVFIPSLPPEVKNNDWIKAEIIFNEDEKGRAAAPIAKVLEVIGQELPASYDVQMVAGEFNLTEHHTYDAVKQAEGYTLDVRPVGSSEKGKDEAGRTDLRHIPFMTIDGERARDFDDAVYVEKTTSGGYLLWVAIADVSHYVKEGTPLDREAFARSTSVYFPERAFHMLPRALSEELCSLKPHVPRLAMAASIEYSAEGKKGKIQIYNTIIESRRRATYTEIQAEKDDPKHADMFALYRLLRIARSARGSIDFDFPEAEIILDEKTGEPSDIVIRERQDSNRLIEEFMIAANESVTEWMLAQKLPFVYRIHEEPSPEAMEKFRKLAKTMGVALADKGGVPKPIVLAEFIRTLVGHAAEPVLANALLRSMRQAIYTSTHNEHYGLASGGYTHFTSPIRRYPDLVVHRLLRAALAKEPPANEEELEQITEHCSYRERIASEAERESIRFKQVRLMAKKIGQEFDGKITGLNERGMFVQLTSPYCEGMVPVDTIEDDWYEFIETRMALVGRKKKRTFTVGTKVKIQVVRVDMDARQVEFKLLDDQ